MSYRGRDRANQLVLVEVSVDFIQHTLSAHEHGQRDSANETIIIVTDNCSSAVNCPIKVEIVPFSWLEPRFLSISQSTHCCYQHTHKKQQKDSANERIAIVTHKIWSAVNCPIEVGIVPLSWLEPRYLSISQSTHTAVVNTKTRNSRETAQKRELQSSLTRK